MAEEKAVAPDVDVEKQAGLEDRASAHSQAQSKSSGTANDEAASVSGSTQANSADESAANVVNWDGPDDPANPQNWSMAKKATIISLVSAMTFLSPLTSSIFAPGVSQVLEEFHVADASIGSFTVSVFLLGYVFGPLVVAPLSELYGRLVIYHVANVTFLLFNIGCALAPSLSALSALRFLAGSSGSIPITVGAASIADVFPREQRGKWMSAWVMGPLVGPVVGPIAGGFLTQSVGWRWTFWLVSICAGVVTILCFIFLRETFAPTLLEWKAAKLRKETGNQNIRSAVEIKQTVVQKLTMAISRPTRLLFLSPIVFLMSLNVAVVYGYLYLLFTTIPAVFEDQYQFSQGTVGLAYLGIGIGSGLGLLVVGRVSDQLQAYLDKKHGRQVPEHRLPPMVAASLFVPVGLFWYGWTAYYKVHWIVPIIGMSFLGIGMTMSFMTTALYLVDAFTVYAASVTAANTVVRSLVGAVLPLAGPKMYATLGLGWGNSLLAFIAIALASVPLLFVKYGERIRNATGIKD